MTTETLTIQPASISIDPNTARQLLRDSLPVARFVVSQTPWGWDDQAAEALQAIVDSDPLWRFFEGLLGTPEGAALSIADLPADAKSDAESENLSPEVLIALLPEIIELAKWLLAGIRKRRGG